jgi:hypothetical protein
MIILTIGQAREILIFLNNVDSPAITALRNKVRNYNEAEAIRLAHLLSPESPQGRGEQE